MLPASTCFKGQEQFRKQYDSAPPTRPHSALTQVVTTTSAVDQFSGADRLQFPASLRCELRLPIDRYPGLNHRAAARVVDPEPAAGLLGALSHAREADVEGTVGRRRTVGKAHAVIRNVQQNAPIALLKRY